MDTFNFPSTSSSTLVLDNTDSSASTIKSPKPAPPFSKVGKKASATSPGQRIRASKACDQCSLKRSKCSGEADGCQKCAQLGLCCSYTRVVKKRGPPKKTDLEKAAAKLAAAREMHQDCENTSTTSSIICMGDSPTTAAPDHRNKATSSLLQLVTVERPTAALTSTGSSSLPSPILSASCSDSGLCSPEATAPIYLADSVVPQSQQDSSSKCNTGDDLYSYFMQPPPQVDIRQFLGSFPVDTTNTISYPLSSLHDQLASSQHHMTDHSFLEPWNTSAFPSFPSYSSYGYPQLQAAYPYDASFASMGLFGGSHMQMPITMSSHTSSDDSDL